ncbi:MAG: sialidase family protein, partial [Nitrososphaeraceae archaeon]
GGPSSPSDILLRKSTDGGATFSDTINVSNTPGGSGSAAIAVSGNEVYIVWTEVSSDKFDILLRKSTNGGASFGSIINLSEEISAFSEQPSVAASGNMVYVVWRETGSTYDEIVYKRSTDGGTTFSKRDNLSNSVGNSALPMVAASGNNVYVFWIDGTTETNENFETLLRKSTDNGASFESTVNLSNSNPNSGRGFVVAAGDNVYVAWGELGRNSEILFRRSTDGGANFGSIVNLSNNAAGSSSPRIAILENKVYVVWSDSTSGNSNIFYSMSTDNGATFQSTINLSNTGRASTPTITATKVDSIPSDTVPPNTSITKVVDGNNAVLPLANPSSAVTVLEKVTITLTGSDNVAIAGFQCSLDGKPFASCASPITFNNLAFGTHTFKVKAIDMAGNADPTPASFTWNILTPAQGVQELKSFVSSMPDVSSGTKASLNAKLDGALRYLSDGSPTNDRGACSYLDGFIRTANAYARAGYISTQQANQIIQTLPYSAEAIKTSLGCA